MKTRMKRMKKPTSKITLLLSNHKTVLYSRLEKCRKSLFGQIARLHRFNLLRAYVGDACQQVPLLDC